MSTPRPWHSQRSRERIRRIVIPPAWRDVWICPDPDGHIQAVGRDARGRKQYRYHPRWRAIRDDAKYDQILSSRRARVAPDSRLPLRRRSEAERGQGAGSRLGVLGNTPSVCRKSYLHPAVIDSYMSRRFARSSSKERAISQPSLRDLARTESAVLKLLRDCQARDRRRQAA
jgi:DNA topoisomerase IB